MQGSSSLASGGRERYADHHGPWPISRTVRPRYAPSQYVCRHRPLDSNSDTGSSLLRPRQGDAEFNPNAKRGLHGEYNGWLERAARERSLGDGQVNFKAVFSKLAGYDVAGWALDDFAATGADRATNLRLPGVTD
jgi:hypothetical protein